MMSLRELLPHREPLLLLDALGEITGEACTALTRVDPEAWYAQGDGSMPAWFGLELMAQAAAAFNGHRNRAQGRPGVGYLLGTPAFETLRPSFPAGMDLEIEARLDGADDTGLSVFQCRITSGGLPLATATLNVLGKPR